MAPSHNHSANLTPDHRSTVLMCAFFPPDLCPLPAGVLAVAALATN